MRILLLNQTFYPDVVATAQYLTELALGLVERGHTVSVVTGRRGYDHQDRLFAKRESWHGIEIYRIGSSGFGKTRRWRRALDFGTYLLNCAWRVLTLPRHDAVLALTSPPLISFLGALLSTMKRSQFFYWIMDLNPDEAVAAGWLHNGSATARALEWVSRFSMRRAARIIVLDRFARQRVCAKGVGAEKVAVIPPWADDDVIRFDPGGRARFRQEHGLDDKFVVMYSGNHSPCHPLDTLLEACKVLSKERPGVVFCFVGGGSGFAGVQQFAAEHGLATLKCLPYQPMEKLSASLSAADMHVVVMGDPYVGIIHPCKIYNILSVTPGDSQPGARRPAILYLGPELSHVSELLVEVADLGDWDWARHGDVDGVVQVIKSKLATGNGGGPKGSRRPGADQTKTSHARFSKRVLLPKMLNLIEDR